MIRVTHQIPHEDIKLLIFDLDGTLVDSQLDLAQTVNAMLREYRRPELPCEVIRSYIGDGAPMLVRRALGDPEDENYVRQAVEFFMAYYREHLLDNTFAYPGIAEQLQRFQQKGYKMAVLSNKPVIPSRRICEGLGIAGYFFSIYGGNSFETKKPDPLGAHKLLEESGATARQAVMIGDSQNDVLTARNAGLWSIGVNYGLSPHTLQIHPPDVLVDAAGELATALGLADTATHSTEVPRSEGFAD